jgi:hypothetical protein
VRRHGKQTLYYHHVLEAKLLGPAGGVSLDSECIENADAGDTKGNSAEEIEQDCELKALHRRRPRLKKAYPELPFVLALDSLYGCGPLFALAEKFEWSDAATFQEGRRPALWREYRALLRACPQNALRREWREGVVQEFRWVSQLDWQDSAGRWWKVNALAGTETTAEGRQYLAWLTALPVGQQTVEEIAHKGGR